VTERADSVHQQEDRIKSGPIVAVGLGALVIFAVGIWWAASVDREATGSLRTVSAPAPLIGRREIGMVFQPPFNEPIAAVRAKADQERLHSVGWADERHRTIHIPIERAMELTVKGGWR
jgi:hypothetical protein